MWYGQADMNTGSARTRRYYGALDAFFPAVLALWAMTGSRGQIAGFELQDVEPGGGRAGAAGLRDYDRLQIREYPLRPEIIESTYYLYHYTHDRQVSGHGENVSSIRW